MRTLHISDELSLPLDAITHKFAILGTSGSGKSYTAMKLGELMLDAGGQIIPVDPVGIWWSNIPRLARCVVRIGCTWEKLHDRSFRAILSRQND